MHILLSCVVREANLVCRLGAAEGKCLPATPSARRPVASHSVHVLLSRVVREGCQRAVSGLIVDEIAADAAKPDFVLFVSA